MPNRLNIMWINFLFSVMNDNGTSIHPSCAQSCLTLCDPTDCSPPVSSVHGISEARILEWVVIFSSRGSSRPRDWTHVSGIAGGVFTVEPLGKPCVCMYMLILECTCHEWQETVLYGKPFFHWMENEWSHSVSWLAHLWVRRYYWIFC